MKKIAFFVQHMLCGGVENALLSLANELEKSGNIIKIYVIKENGEFIAKAKEKFDLVEIPMDKKIRNLIPVGGIKLSVKECLHKKQYINAFKMSVNHVMKKSDFAELKLDFSKILNLDEKFDIAVNFHMHSPFLVKYLSEKVNADVKYTWMHNDFSTTNYNIKALEKYLMCNKAFFGVSQKLVNEFTDIFPNYKEITSVALNIVPTDEIKEKAELFYPSEYKSNKLNLLSVGRLEEQKGYDLTIEVAKLLDQQNIEFTWFILGEGSLRNTLENLLKKYNLEDKVHFLGIRANPYPYFKNCDIYVQTSYHEGYVTTVTEAKIFNRPIVCTDVSGAREQLVDGVSGDIAEINIDSIYGKLSNLIQSESKRISYQKALEENKEENICEYIEMFK